MQIKRSKKYQLELLQILKYIANDKVSASEDFKNILDDHINNLIHAPFIYRASHYFNNKNIRDMTYKGYTVIYEVNFEENFIDIIKIFNKNKPSKIR